MVAIGTSSVDRLARSKRPIVERTEIHIPPAPQLSSEAVTGPTANRLSAVSRFNTDLQKWRNDAWAVEMPGQPDFALQADVATLRADTKAMIANIATNTLNITNIQTDITNLTTAITEIDNSITTIDNRITIIEGNAITGTGIVQANGANPPTAILGTPGHVPYWTSVGPPYISLTSPIYTDGTSVGIGTDLPAVLLDVGLAGTTPGVMRLSGGTSGNVTIQTAAAAGAWTFTLPVNDGSANEFLKTNGSGVTSWSSVVLTTDVSGLLPTANGGTNHGLYTAGSVIFAGAGGLLLTEDNANLFYDDANNRLGVGTAAPANRLQVLWKSGDTTATAEFGSVNASNNQVAVDAYSSTSTGIRGNSASGTALSGISNTGTAGTFYVNATPTTNAVIDVVTLRAATTGLAAANFGTGIRFITETSANDNRDSARIQAIWTDATDATRTSSLQFQTVNSAAALATRVWIEGNGNVGVGISPTTNFHVYSASGNVIQFIQGPTSGQETSLLFAGSGGNWKIGQQNTLFSGSLAFCLNSLGTPLVLFSRTGNVGIGMGANVPGALLDLGLAGTTLGVMRMAGSTSGNVTIQPQAIAGTWTLQLPQNDGGAGEFLRTDGGGITSWASVTPTYAFTEGSVIFAGAGGTSLAEDNANFFYDNAENQLRLGPSSGVPGPLVVFSSSIARTASTRNAQILSTDTSSTANISKSGIYQVTTGTWNGTNSTVYGIWNYAAGFANSTDGPTFLYGIRSEVEYGCDASYAGYFRNASNVLINDAVAVYAVSEPVACARDNYAGYFSATTNGTNLYGLRSSAVGGTTAYGLYCEATGATNNYGIFVNAGTTRIAAGTTTIAPLLFTSGVDLTTPTAGVMEYDGRFELTDVDAVRRHIVQAVAATKTTAGAPYANDGYVDMVINGTTIRFLTTA